MNKEMKRSGWILVIVAALSLFSCTRDTPGDIPPAEKDPKKGTLIPATTFHLEFPKEFGGMRIDNAAYYTDSLALRMNSAVRDGSGSCLLELPLPDGAEFVAVVGCSDVRPLSLERFSLPSPLPAARWGGLKECFLAAGRHAGGTDAVSMNILPSIMEFTMDDGRVNTLLIRSVSGKAFCGYRSVTFSTEDGGVLSAEGPASDRMTVYGPFNGAVYAGLLPGEYEGGFTVEARDSRGDPLSRYVIEESSFPRGAVPVELRAAASPETPVTPPAEPPGDVPSPEPDTVRVSGLRVPEFENPVQVFRPVFPSAVYEGRECPCRVEPCGPDVKTIQGGIAVMAPGRHDVKVYARVDGTLVVWDVFTLDVWMDTEVSLFLQAKEGLAETYGNSQLALSSDTAVPIVLEFGIKGSADPAVGKTKTKWIFPKQEVTLHWLETVTLAEYDDLVSFVKDHALSAFSVDVYLECRTENVNVDFDASNIKANLDKAAGKHVTVRYNGTKLW